ncbi:MAG: phosphatidylglycerophosphatase A [Persicimonas sp.]
MNAQEEVGDSSEQDQPDTPRLDQGERPGFGDAWHDSPLSMLVATFGGIGHLPGGPGTYAAALFTPAVVWMSQYDLELRLACFWAATFLSFYWCGKAGRALGEPDSDLIVLDEVIGVWATLVLFSDLYEDFLWLPALAGLIAFRILDVVKPPPARRLDDSQHGGAAVVADDLVAALWSIPVVLLVRWLLTM